MLKHFALLLAFTPFLAFAADEIPASDASIRRLLEVSQSRQLIDGMRPQIEASITAAITESTDMKKLSPERAEILEDMKREMVEMLIEDMNWERMEPEFIEIYRSAFTESEVQGMLEFYESEAGQAMVRKMPRVMQGSMEMVQAQMQRLTPKLQELQQRTTERLRTCCKAKH